MNPCPHGTDWLRQCARCLRGAHGAAGRLDRLRMLGNGVVWQQAAFALSDLAQRARGSE